MIYSNGPAVQLEPAPQAVAVTAPRIRPVRLAPGLEGRLYTATPGAYGDDCVGLRVTARGHWYRTDDEHGSPTSPTRRCRGCGATAPFGYLLDAVRCLDAPSGQDIASALLGRAGVSA